MKHPFRVDKCKSCGKPMVWAKGPNGMIPLDPIAPVYGAYFDENNFAIAMRFEAGGKIVYPMVSHFSTCPSAAQHSKTNK